MRFTKERLGLSMLASPDSAYPAGGRFAARDIVEAMVRRAAAGIQDAILAVEADGIAYTPDQWNWFRWQENGDQTTADLFPPGERAVSVSASEYIARRVAAGLAR